MNNDQDFVINFLREQAAKKREERKQLDQTILGPTWHDPDRFSAPNMTPKQYAAAIETLGLSQRAAGAFLGVDERTSRRWVLGESAIPESAAKLLRLMVRLKVPPDEVI